MPLLDEYPTGPCLIIGDNEAQAVAIIALDWPWGLVDGLAVFTLTDSARTELVIPAHLRPNQGDGAVCPCGGDPKCAGCGGTGVFRGSRDAIVVYALTPEGCDECVAYTSEGPVTMSVVGGFIPKVFGVALKNRRSVHEPMPLEVVLDALKEFPRLKVRWI